MEADIRQISIRQDAFEILIEALEVDDRADAVGKNQVLAGLILMSELPVMFLEDIQCQFSKDDRAVACFRFRTVELKTLSRYVLKLSLDPDRTSPSRYRTILDRSTRRIACQS